MAYWECGDSNNDKVLLCVHGLTRTGRDFDALARRLSSDYRVVCPDVVGRGKSDWLINAAGYVVPQYVADILTLIARLNPARLDWVGTSMGGLIGMGLVGALAMSTAARPARGPFGLAAEQTLRLGKVVLNDIGPSLSFTGLTRIDRKSIVSGKSVSVRVALGGSRNYKKTIQQIKVQNRIPNK